MTDEQLLARAHTIMERVRRSHYRPPDPSRLTPWAYEVCCEHCITESQLYEWLLVQGEDYSSAYRLIYGPPPHEVFGDDWVALAEYMRKHFGWSLEAVANYVRGWHDSQNASTVRRALDPEAREKQREYDNAYQARVRADPEKHERQKARMREYYHRQKET